MKYKLKPYDEVNNIWLLYKKNFWFFWSFVGSGRRAELEDFVKKNNGTF